LWYKDEGMSETKRVVRVQGLYTKMDATMYVTIGMGKGMCSLFPMGSPTSFPRYTDYHLVPQTKNKIQYEDLDSLLSMGIVSPPIAETPFQALLHPPR